MTRARRALAATAAAALLTAGLAPPASAGTTTRTWPGAWRAADLDGAS